MITKLLAGALAVMVLIATFLYWQADRAKERAAVAETALTTANAETDQANKQLTEVVDEYGKREDEITRQANRSEQFKRRALFAERELGDLVASGDTDAFDLRMCETIDRIEGGNSEDREARCIATRETRTPARKYYRIDERSVLNNLTNYERFAEFTDQCLLRLHPP